MCVFFFKCLKGALVDTGHLGVDYVSIIGSRFSGRCMELFEIRNSERVTRGQLSSRANPGKQSTGLIVPNLRTRDRRAA